MKVGVAAVPKEADQASGFLDDVEQGGAGIVALIGHNDGSAIVFADGSRAALSAIASANSKTKVVVVSCGDALTVNGQTVADAGLLEWLVGVDTLRRFSEAVTASGRKPAQMTLAETKQLVAQAYTDAKQADRNATTIRATVGVTGGVVSLTIYAVTT